MTKSFKSFSKNRHKEVYYKDAKKIEVRARSYFKLEQIDNKFELIKDNMNIIDLGCAPGGWLEYIDSKVKTGQIVGIDLLEIRSQHEFSSNVKIIEDDFNEIESYKLGEFDLVLSDMAPEFCGDSKADRGRCHKLNLETIEFCSKHLIKGGNLAFKTFGGEDLDYIRDKCRKMFDEVKEFKPNSSQKKSSEMFIICLKKL